MSSRWPRELIRRAHDRADDSKDVLRTQHFRLSPLAHPLDAKPDERDTSKLQHHIWTKAEINERLKTYNDTHTPVTFSDHVMHSIMYYGMYHPFNVLTGYRQVNPSPWSIEWRLIILESVAGVPGFVAAGFRHFRSLRRLQRDNGWIGTLLQEADNERMHLLVCMCMFEASPLTRILVVAAQVSMTPFFMAVYMLNPKALHRFVGYFEQTACRTYHNIITHIETPGTDLHSAWSQLPAPEIAVGYWRLDDDAKWVDVLKCIFADESNHRFAHQHHRPTHSRAPATTCITPTALTSTATCAAANRDVNHTFASIASDDPNPFLTKRHASKAWKEVQDQAEHDDKLHNST
jgi:hypothetical protein